MLSQASVIAIQVSLESLTAHKPPNHVFLRSFGAYTPKRVTRNHDWRYIHVTTSPERHPIIALQSEWNGVSVDRIRLVDANAWLRLGQV